VLSAEGLALRCRRHATAFHRRPRPGSIVGIIPSDWPRCFHGKIDAPSGTARELATRLSKVRPPEPSVPVNPTVGPREARGATLSGSQVHSLRLRGYVISAAIIFEMPDQRLTIRHDSGGSARPYVSGALLAIHQVSTLVGVHRGLDSVLDL